MFSYRLCHSIVGSRVGNMFRFNCTHFSLVSLVFGFWFPQESIALIVPIPVELENLRYPLPHEILRYLDHRFPLPEAIGCHHWWFTCRGLTEDEVEGVGSYEECAVMCRYVIYYN